MQDKIDWFIVGVVGVSFICGILMALLFVLSGSYAYPVASVVLFSLSMTVLFLSFQCIELFDLKSANKGKALLAVYSLLFSTVFPISFLAIPSASCAALCLLVQFLLLFCVYNCIKVDAGYIWIVNNRVYFEGETIKVNPFLVYKIFSLPVNLGRTVRIVLTDMSLPCREGVCCITVKTDIQVKLNPSGDKITSLDYELFLKEIKEWLMGHLLLLAADKTLLEFLASFFHVESKCVIQGLEVSLFNFDSKEIRATSQSETRG